MPDPQAAPPAGADGADAPFSAVPEDFHGQPAVRLRAGPGDSALVALHGAQVLSWQAGGAEQLYLSPRAVFDGQAAVRGGVPICFPQFNQRGPLPKHGFARNLPWAASQAAHDPARSESRLPLGLHDSAETLALWPHAFAAQLEVVLGAGSLRLHFTVENTGTRPLQFTLALHGYLRVADIADTTVDGLDGRPGWDSLTDRRAPQRGPIRFDGEFDRVYDARAARLLLEGGGGRPPLRIAQSESFGNTVVWNPGAALCATLADLPDDGYRQMVCVEAAQIDTPVQLAPGARWQGWQQMSLAPTLGTGVSPLPSEARAPGMPSSPSSDGA